MPCTDRQLTPAQIEAGFKNQRTGVGKGIRPFSGKPTNENIADYLNREVYPVLKAARDKINDVYLQVTDNAPSGNPLSYYFSTNTVNSDPTAGRLKLDAGSQSSAGTIRVSGLNSQLVNAQPWLDVMKGSATLPLGVVTLTDAINPGRWIRWDLISMQDQGAYWDLILGGAPIDQSHDDPFVDGGAVVLSFIPGVASSGAGGAFASPVVHIVSMAANVTQSFNNATGRAITSGTLFVPEFDSTNTNFSLNNVFFRASGNSMLGLARFPVRAGTLAANAYDLSFSNANNVSFGQQTSTFAAVGQIAIITASASYDRDIGLLSHVGGNSVLSATRLAFSNNNGISFGLSTAAGAATLTASYARELQLVRAFGTDGALKPADQAFSITQLLFSDRTGHSWSVASGAGFAVVQLSVAPQTFIGGLAAGTQTATSGTIVFSNSNNVSFTMNGSTQVVASVTVASSALSFSAGTSSVGLGSIVFSNSNGVSFGLNGSTVTGSYAREMGLVSHIGGQSVASVTRLAFSNDSNVTWSLSTAAGGATVIASVAAAGAGGGIAAAAGTQTATSGTVVWSDSNGVSFGMSGSTRVTASYAREIGLFSQVGGDAIASATRLAFSNVNGITFGLSTAASAATLTASISAVQKVAAGASAINGTTGISFLDANNVSFGLSTNAGTAGSMFITASATVAATRELGIVSHVGGQVVSSVSRLAFSNASNVSFSLSTAAGAATLLAGITGMGISAGTQSVSTGTLVFSDSNNISFGMSGSSRVTASFQPGVSAISAGAAAITSGQVVFSNSNNVSFGVNGQTVTASAGPILSYWRNFDGGSLGGVLSNNPAGFTSQLYWAFPMADRALFFPGRMTMGTLGILGGGSGASTLTGSFSLVMRGGIYTMVNSTQLSLLNSFVTTFSQTTAAAGARTAFWSNERLVTVHSSQWSSQPVLTQGAYWMILNGDISNNAAGISFAWRYANLPNAVNYSGAAGISRTNVRLVHPFWGAFTSSTPLSGASSTLMPASVGSANMLTASSVQLSAYPAVAVYDGLPFE